MRKLVAPALVLAFPAALLGGCTTAASRQHQAAADHPQAQLYDENRDAASDVDAAMAKAATGGKNVLVAMGANWCHDSRAFAGWMQTPRFADMLAQRYETVFVDVGHPQEGKGRNLDVARRFGLNEITGTPTVLVISPDGRLLNRDTAASWRNAASRSADAIYGELSAFPLP